MTQARSHHSSRDHPEVVAACVQALQAWPGHSEATQMQAAAEQAIADADRCCEEANRLLKLTELVKADASCSQSLNIYPTHQKALALQPKIKLEITSAEQHYATAASVFAGASLLDVAAMRRVDEECSLALQAFTGHRAARELREKAGEGLQVDKTFQQGQVEISEAQYASAAASFAEAARLIMSSGGVVSAGPLRLRLADCFTKMGECDTNMISPPPSAETLYTEAISIYSAVEAQAEQHQKQLAGLFKARAYVRHAHGNLQGAAEDIEQAAGVEQGVSDGEGKGACTAQEEWLGHLRDTPLLSRMARAPQGTKVQIEVCLNERWVPTRGYSSGHLMAGDPEMFTASDGGPQPGYRGERHGTPADKDLQLPAGWCFEDQWTPPPPESGTADKDGFEYAKGFDKYDFSPQSFMSAVVRRRRLSRTAVKSLPASTIETVPLYVGLLSGAPQLPCCNLSQVGFLRKEGGQVRNWKRRWFALQTVSADECLELTYSDFSVRGAPTEVKGCIPLKNVTSVGVDSSKAEEKGKQPPAITLTTEGRVYLLQADSAAEHEDWLQALRLAVRVATGQQDWPSAPRVETRDYKS